ncbi:MAG: VanW family protein [Candidatus Caccovivens sp.]
MKKEEQNKQEKNKSLKSKNTNQKKTKQKGLLWFLGASALSVTLLLCCQFFFANTITGRERFYDNTRINGIDVSGMSVAEAENVVLTDMLEHKNEVEIELVSGQKSWTLSGNDFEVANKIQPVIAEVSKFGKNGNFFQNLKVEREIRENGKDFQVSYTNLLSNINEKIDEIISEVEQEAKPASLIFQPDETETFAVYKGQNAILVNRDQLYQEIDNALKVSKKIKVEIPIIEIENEIDLDALENSVIKRSEFSTSYAKSSASRKNNIKKALSAFNGMIVQPGQTVSFNETTGPRTESEGYKSAHIIVGGVYVDGVGGGVCQASTTLYNALLLADIDVLSVNHHSLPASYVPLSFDAMVSGSYSDLVFKNNLETPIYIKTFADDENIKVEVYGEKFDDGITIKRRAELVKILPHNGDRIVADTKGEYANKILYKGEYLRVKYPREGYESKGYLQYYKDGQLLEEKEIRHDFYQPQEGIVMEGVESPVEGMTIPVSDVKIIKPQKVTKQTEDNIKIKLSKQNPSEYNP